MPESTESGPAGNAGETDGLKQAFDAAVEELGLSDQEHLADSTPTARSETFRAEGESGFGENTRERRGEHPREKFRRAERPRLERIAPPAHWDAEKRAAFGRLPPEAKRIVLDLGRAGEAHLTRKSMELSEHQRFSENVRSLIHDGHREQMRRSGIPNEVEGIALLLRMNDIATRDPASYVRWIAQSARLDPRTVFPEAFGGAPVTTQNPELRQLQETIRALSGKVDGFERSRAESARRAQEQQLDAVRSAVARVQGETDAAGIPKYPHFTRLQPAIMALVGSHPSIRSIPDFGERLARAYEVAVLSDPELKDAAMASAIGRRDAERRRAADVEKARRAKAPLRAAPSTAPGRRRATTLDEAIRQAMGQLGV